MIVALLNQKGGTGKTTLALHLAGAWARQGNLPHVAWVDSLDGLAAIRDSGTTMAIPPACRMRPSPPSPVFGDEPDFCCLRCEAREREGRRHPGRSRRQANENENSDHSTQ